MLATIDGEERSFELREVSRVLLNTSEEDKGKYEISPSGYGIHWPVLDEYGSSACRSVPFPCVTFCVTHS